MNSISKSLLICGVIFILAGILIQYGPKIPWIGRLPGDICIRKSNFSFYAPISTCIIISIIVSIILYIFGRR
ncbi:DUF2905 domain-containing protein [Candidatus Omnitrophota bacterium]